MCIRDRKEDQEWDGAILREVQQSARCRRRRRISSESIGNEYIPTLYTKINVVHKGINKYKHICNNIKHASQYAEHNLS